MSVWLKGGPGAQEGTVGTAAPQPERPLHNEPHSWAPNPKGGSGLVGPDQCQPVRASKHLSVGKQAALRISGVVPGQAVRQAGG